MNEREQRVARWYRTLLLCFPRQFRRDYGSDLTLTFLARWRTTHADRRTARWKFWLRTTWDVVLNGVLERWAGLRRQRAQLPVIPAPPARRGSSMDQLLRDLRYAARSVRRAPGVTLIIIVTLSLGIGASTAVFGIADAVLFRPLPFPDADRLAIVWGSHPQIGRETASYPDYTDWRDRNSVFEAMAAFVPQSQNLTSGEGEAIRVRAALITGPLFEVMGVPPLAGRAPTAEEDRPGAERVAIISHGLWQRRFGGASDLLGGTVHLQGQPHTVIGIAPETFAFPRGADLWIPMARDPADFGRRSDFLTVVGRLRSGVTVQAAGVELAGIAANLTRAYPETNTDWSTELVPLYDQLVGDVRPVLLTFLGAVGFVLLIVCANVANLLLARATTRGSEMAIRSALGAGRGRLIRQLMTEAGVLGVLGGVLGVALATVALRALVAASPDLVPRLDQVTINGRVLGYAAIVSLGTGLLFGLTPALHLARSSTTALLHNGTRTVKGAGAARARAALIVTQVALAVVLLVGAGLTMRSFLSLQHTDPGFDPDRLLTFRVSLPGIAYPDSTSVLSFYDQLRREAQALPGVSSVALTTDLPLEAGNFLSFLIEGRPDPDRSTVQDAVVQVVDHGYQPTLRIPIRRGRGFHASDRLGAEPAALINETLARRYFDGDDPIGQGIRFSPEGPWHRIVGVAADQRNEGLASDPYPQVFLPFDQLPRSNLAVVLRAAGDPSALVAPVRGIVRSLDPALPISQLMTMTDWIGDTVARPRFSFQLTLVMAAVAIGLATVGIFGMLSYAVAERTGEIGVRMALGASARTVTRHIVVQGAALALTGGIIGTVGAAALSRLLTRLLVSVRPLDPATYLGVGAILIAATASATYLPARRASRVDPMEALRGE